MKNEDLNIMKAIIIYLDWLDGCNKDYHPKGNYTIQDMISWIRKQCDKNPDDKIEQEWVPQVGDTIRKKGTTEPLYVLTGKEEYEFSFVEKRNCGISGGKLNVFALEDYELVERNKTIENVIDETFNPLNEFSNKQKSYWIENKNNSTTLKVQKIKKEIERLQSNLNKYISPNNPILPGTLNVTFNRLKDFIDSLTEDDTSDDLENQYNSNMCYQHAYTQDDIMKTKNDELEKEIERYFRDVKWIYLPVAEVARHFADWQYNKDFEDLLKSDMSQFKKCYEKGREDMKNELKQITIE
jgi:hypothetical protein